MTRERAKELAPIIAAYAEGKDIEYRVNEDDSWDIQYEPIFTGKGDYRIKPESKRRLMTREEVLGFIANTKGIVTRFGHGSRSSWAIPDFGLNYDHIDEYEWAEITKSGQIGDPRKFYVDE